MRLLVISLLCVSIISLFIVVLSFVTPLKPISDTKDLVKPTAQLYFQPQDIFSACNNASHSAKIALLSNSNSLQSAQIELSYNPGFFYNVSISEASPNVLGQKNTVDINEIRDNYGRASFVISSKDVVNNTGSFEVAVLSFNVYPQPASTSSTIKFLNKSRVQDAHSRTSILTEALPLTIHCD